MKGLSLIVMLLLSMLALGLAASQSPRSGFQVAIQTVVVLAATSGLGAIAFLLGRSHARSAGSRFGRPPIQF